MAATQEERLRKIVSKWSHIGGPSDMIGGTACHPSCHRCQVEQALSAAPAWSHQPENLDCECHDCQKNAIEQLRHQLDLRAAAPAPSPLTEEAQREVYLQWWHSISQLDRLHLTLRDAFDAGVREGRYGKASK